MKIFKVNILLHLVLALFCLKLKAQQTKQGELNARVQNSKGEPVQGASVISLGNEITNTDKEGAFSIITTPGKRLVITALGYQSLTIDADTTLKLITLKSEADQVQVAFQKQDRSEILGGVSNFNVAEMLEKNYYMSTSDYLSSFLPGYNGTNGNVWGSGTLTMVDGVPRDIGNVLPTEIDQITLLKGAQAVALYGSQASRGVLIVTTKRGTSGQDAFKVRFNAGVFTPRGYPDYVGAAEYMTLYNEARRNDGAGTLYDDVTINNTASGKNLFRYPDVNYYSSEFLKKSVNRADVTAEFRGGNEKARFYANMGFYQQGSLLNVGTGKDEGVSRFNVRGNLDIKFNKAITGKINASLAYYDTKTAKGNYWGNAATLRPNWYAPLIPLSAVENPNDPKWQTFKDSPFLVDGQYLVGGRQDMTTTPFGALYTQGLEKYSSRQFQFDAGLNFDLGSALKGLTFNTVFGLDYYNRFYLSENINDYSVQVATWNANDKITNIQRYGLVDKASRGRSLTDAYQRLVTFYSGQFNYKNTFNKVHNVSGLLLVNAFLRQISEVYHGDGNANLGFQAGYNYDQKYYVDFTSNYVHSAKLESQNSNAFSPVVTVGWRMSKEKFLAKSSVVNDLRLTATAGILHTDMDFTEYFLFRSAYGNGDAFRFNEGRQSNGTNVLRGANANLVFVQRKELNFGVDATLFNRLLQVNASYYRIEMNGLPLKNANAYPNYFVFGSTNFIPAIENYNNNLYTGFDFGASINKRVGQVGLNVGLTGTYINNKALKRREVYEAKWSYLSRVGQPVDGIWGLQSDGFFMNQAQINASPSQTGIAGSSLRAGDLKYVDQNGDGKIDNNDIVYLARSTPSFILGLNITAKWKNFTLFMLLNGATGGKGNKTNDYFRVRQERKYSEYVRDRTIINKDVSGNWEVTQLGAYPRLTTTAGDNNFRDSDFWLYDNSYINLSKVQLSYDFPTGVIKSKIVKNLGVYVSGFDLLTISKNRKILQTNIGAAPQLTFFNLGVKATL
ncbi:SusC/RagA family TonB-linked outer membrane protein [Mucilaginibacter auburnensis]|uniref:TonB-linked SusC/RagA family outer membrane protein n=1 Tax=Mucilaginibacter auburnensis TaxID=1457233 RepID=A0A2H9VLP7_9SPHI|nr:SusC/RagA family TonB-linked outer membrane protein [Mucilaginibacter auburnensis]PJJ79242.1 TonB-linked SusC/RagA family outer membrane protein [Mucilaginibacter auburnensis]